MKVIVLDSCVIKRCLKHQKYGLLKNTKSMFFQKEELSVSQKKQLISVQDSLPKLENQDCSLKDDNFLLLSEDYWVVTYDKALKLKLKKKGLLAPLEVLTLYSNV